MKYIEKMLIIIAICFLGEFLHYILPLPIPASIYGFMILFILLITKVIKVEKIRPVTDFLLNIMPIVFIAPGVGIINTAQELQSMLIPAVLSMTLGTVIIMGAVALVVEKILKVGKKEEDINE